MGFPNPTVMDHFSGRVRGGHPPRSHNRRSASGTSQEHQVKSNTLKAIVSVLEPVGIRRLGGAGALTPGSPVGVGFPSENSILLSTSLLPYPWANLKLNLISKRLSALF